ncbi:Gfo/Idh/MocA family protein [Mycobacterium sp. shizuoka-1]|uniref:Gfo/Idh/MocA family protein n=1 Tax=Mycobacterium sp. shizuoka-1 TaxID=2039281 RepID=UPI000C0604E6|nr:Gfo/Idh/MocA family oxidoreductase [Mycobacterium sp. shizuoka-1]GAY14810.1 oxidoreductase [Mycobacterium sp. shizuoka-1]
MADAGGAVRIGILGTARVAPAVLIKPAKKNPEVVVAAVAAREVSRAQEFAGKHGIARAYDGYEALIADPDIDAVYIPLPNALHGRWTRAALQAGKHVLCEKPFMANATEALEIADLAATSGRVVMEAFHYRYHPFAARVEQIIASGELGTLQRIEAADCYWLRNFAANAYNYSLGGGALMDLGSYVVDMLRTFGGSTPEVVSAQAKLRGQNVDRAMTAELRFPEGHTGRLHCSLWSRTPPHYTAKIVGDRGELRLHPVIPYQQFSVKSADGHRVERFFKARPTYEYQLEAFAAAVLRGAPIKTSAAEGVQNMKVIDAIYRAAGLPVREPA